MTANKSIQSKILLIVLLISSCGSDSKSDSKVNSSILINTRSKIASFCISENENVIVTLSEDKTLCIWNRDGAFLNAFRWFPERFLRG